MRYKLQVALAIFFPIYLSIILLTNFSLTGFWTDIAVSVLLSIFALWQIFKIKTNMFWLTLVLKITNIICSIIVFGLLSINLINPFAWSEILNIRSFYYQSVNGRLFHAYFKPLGAYGRAYGSFWITETPKYCPIIEYRVFYERATDYDFNSDYFENTPIGDVIKSYIENDVINKTTKVDTH